MTTHQIYRSLLSAIEANFSPSSASDIRQALRIAIRTLRGQTRYNGDPFVTHSIQSAMIVMSEIGLGRNSVIATLLHDCARLGLVGYDQIEQQFGQECAVVVKGLSNISEVDPKHSTLQVDNFRELILSYSADPRVILIKMADRLEVMRSLASFPELKRNKKSWETLNLYSQIAHKLGLYAIKSEMEDLALRYLEPKEYASIERKLIESEDARLKFIADFVAPINEKLQTLGITYKLKSRTKSIYSIWRKMRKQKVQFEEVYDIFAIRIVIDCPPESEKMLCWSAFSVVTDFYTPNPERMRDWISIPKSNGYESLHATVVTTTGRWVEVQIRTSRMDAVAERGVAAHWRYKGVGGGLGSEAWLARLREIVETAQHTDASKEQFDLAQSSSEMFIFTPNGDLRKLPKGATLLDFAFDIHSGLGASCIGGKVNGRNVPIKEVIHNGDLVEITTSKNQRPKSDWLSIVVTGKARNKIKQILREDQARQAQLGREELERKIKNWKLTLTIEEAVNTLAKQYKVKTGFEVYALISEQKVTMADVKERLQRSIDGTIPISEAKPRKTKVAAVSQDDDADCLIIDETLRDVEYKLGKCCNPIFGDPIFGFVTIHGGITIHRNDCPNSHRLREHYPYRILESKWRETLRGGAFRATIRITGEDLLGLASRVTDLINHDLKINIRAMSFNAAQGSIDGTISIEVKNSSIVDMVIHKLKKTKGIQRAYRVN